MIEGRSDQSLIGKFGGVASGARLLLWEPGPVGAPVLKDVHRGFVERTQRVRRGCGGDLAADHRADLRGASDPQLDAVRVLTVSARQSWPHSKPSTPPPTVDAAAEAFEDFVNSTLGQLHAW